MTTGSNNESRRPRAAPPQLTFDDGSRAIQEPLDTTIGSNGAQDMPSGRDQSTSIRDYYEIDRLAQQVLNLKDSQESNWKNRIALQFPDELLGDAPEVCWLFELALPDAFVFCLGDTTYQSCCPDQVAAAHLQADCLIHYGHACLSKCSMPVLYSFGKAALSIDRALDAISTEVSNASVKKLLVLYDVRYHVHMPELEERIRSETGIEVIMGKIPKTVHKTQGSNSTSPTANVGCGDENCCASTTAGACNNESPGTVSTETNTETTASIVPSSDSLSTSTTGGLELPLDFDNNGPFTFLFIGEETSLQYMNIVLRFLSIKTPPENYWIWRPTLESMITQLSPHFQKKLNRRFYMVQKAKLASVYGVLVANLSERHTRSAVLQIQRMVKNHDRSSYIFAVGKINPAKLANFGEIDCFVLVACPEHSLLENDRDFPIPIITPAELSMALGVTEWGEVEYSLNIDDYLKNAGAELVEGQNDNDEDEDEDDDAPYFNPVSGQYESAIVKDDSIDLAALPGKGTLTTYNSAAADFLKQREYQGLQVEAGQTEVRIAVEGQKGIASNYSER